jgi:hypothetical protein
MSKAPTKNSVAGIDRLSTTGRFHRRGTLPSAGLPMMYRCWLSLVSWIAAQSTGLRTIPLAGKFDWNTCRIPSRIVSIRCFAVATKRH